MTEQEMTFIQQQVYIACMAYFPDCDITSAGVIICHRKGKQFAIVEINYPEYYGEAPSFDIWGWTFDNSYYMTYEILMEKLKWIAHNAPDRTED